jgi:hypothetical protein
MTEPDIEWYWDWAMIHADKNGFWWSPVNTFDLVYAIKCDSFKPHKWNVCRVEFDLNTTEEQIQQTMNTLLDVCRMRYADELLNEGERK